MSGTDKTHLSRAIAPQPREIKAGFIVSWLLLLLRLPIGSSNGGNFPVLLTNAHQKEQVTLPAPRFFEMTELGHPKPEFSFSCDRSLPLAQSLAQPNHHFAW
ncbi:MAG: hypothetical protein ACM37W_05535 [Actinomycetota bacterium]